VTVSTVGYGDFNVQSGYGRTFVAFLIAVMLVVVPLQTGQLIEMSSKLSSYSGSYNPLAGKSQQHILLCSEVGDQDDLVDMLNNFFNTTDGPALKTPVVILHPQEPSQQLLGAMNRRHAMFRYLQVLPFRRLSFRLRLGSPPPRRPPHCQGDLPPRQCPVVARPGEGKAE
jgi:hypothetical protein